MFLTEAEIVKLTKRKRHTSQAEELRAMGIEHRARSDGSLVVLSAHVAHIFDPGAAVAVKQTRTGPNWGAITNA